MRNFARTRGWPALVVCLALLLLNVWPATARQNSSKAGPGASPSAVTARRSSPQAGPQASPASTGAQESSPETSPSAAAEEIRTLLLSAQLRLGDDRAEAAGLAEQAFSLYGQALAPELSVQAAEAHRRVEAALEQLAGAATAPEFAHARARAWTALLGGAAQVVEAALAAGDASLAAGWLPVREFRTANRYERPRADATLAVAGFAAGEIPAGDALLAVQADLLDTYQARLNEALRDLPAAGQNGFAARRAELAGLAEGYFAILSPAYAQQRGAAALADAQAAFAALAGADDLPAAVQGAHTALEGFRAAPLGPKEQARRAGQLLRFVSLVPVEYGRGVSQGRVIHDFEIQEALTFHQAAYAAFTDLQDALPAETNAPAQALFEQIDAQLAQASLGGAAAEPDEVRKAATDLQNILQAAMPEEWLSASAQGDFDVIAALLDQMEAAVRGGDYALAESARLEAYAVMEVGPEARLIVLAPQLAPEIEAFFWNGESQPPGLARLIDRQAELSEIQASRAQLDTLLADAEQALGRESSPLAVATNAGVIVFREGMEAVVILASLLSSMRRAEERRFRRPMWLGVLAALAATLLTWMLARGVLQSLARYGERLEAIVSLIAVAVLLVIMNWFFHKVYWTSWIAQFHSRKRSLLKGEAGLMLGLVTLGFTSVYREGFEVVLFLQALVLAAGSGVVLAGTAAGLLLVVLLGILTFKLQVHLPYRSMLTITGIMLGAVLLQIVGKTVYSLQVVGWLPIHSMQPLSFPYWLGSWFGIYPTWEGLVLQTLAAGFVIGSYFLAEWMQRRKRTGSQAVV